MSKDTYSIVHCYKVLVSTVMDFFCYPTVFVCTYKTYQSYYH